MIGAIICIAVGIAMITIGFLIWKFEKISLLHSYHYDNVSETDKKSFCTVTGLGVLVIGLGSLVTGIIMGITDSLWSLAGITVGFIAGFALLSVGAKYNR